MPGPQVNILELCYDFYVIYKVYELCVYALYKMVVSGESKQNSARKHAQVLTDQIQKRKDTQQLLVLKVANRTDLRTKAFAFHTSLQ
jgi:hypothetical protein